MRTEGGKSFFIYDTALREDDIIFHAKPHTTVETKNIIV